MDIEQLKLVLEAVGNATDSAAWVAVMWVGMGYFRVLVLAATWTVVVCVVAKATQAIVLAVSGSGLDGVMKQVNCSWDSWYGPDRARFMNWINERIAESK